ncbi:Hpt domain-containing protein [Paracraurococcus lichenis]|uniref:PAS-domain containing protein n=1 Tax=Paracraurococcus lichenis TaxID=3064888 RepID=A0ABT9E568_9PROT|nr:Hpt domain-containing protein [Paracraurococcus sp. LOR1-02]MDO9711303.1 PAS-domain containing protein [Paracraurococcus sp. LOR1-02]
MSLGPGGPRSVAAMLVAAGTGGMILWTVPLLLLGTDVPDAPLRLATLLLPSVLATAALALGCGAWLGRSGRAERAVEGPSAAQPPVAPPQEPLRPALERKAREERRVALLLDAAAPGAALFDAARRLVAWNAGFAALAEVPPAALARGLPLAELILLQSADEHRRMSPRFVEAGIAGAARRRHRDGGAVEDRWRPGEDGEMLLTCTPVADAGSGPSTSTELSSLCEEEVRTRLPRLQAAIATGDAVAVRVEAHAIRGVAAGFGLGALAEALGSLEAAARAGDLVALAAASPGLPVLAEDALRQLARLAA